MSFDKPAVVIDNGSQCVKAGFSCDNHPVSIFRNTVGRPLYLNGRVGREPYDVHVGDEAVERGADLELNNPVQRGRVVHWDNMERVWHHIFYKELKVAPEDRGVILGVSSTTPMIEKYKYCEVLFEVLNVPCICIQPQCVLALYGSGCTTGIAVDLGYDTVDINPIYEGGMIAYAHMQTGVAGEQLSQYIRDRLTDRGLNIGPHTDTIIENIKMKCCYVSPNAAIPLRRASYERMYTLPSDEEIEVSEEAFAAPELIFQPDLIQMSKAAAGVLSLHEAVVTSALKCDDELRSELYDAIVVCGGLATMPGITERLAIELENISNASVRTVESTEPHVLSWLGGALFAGIRDSQKLWITKKQFEDSGMKVVRKKFL